MNFSPSVTTPLTPGSLQHDLYALSLVKLRNQLNKRWKEEPEVFSCMMDIQRVLNSMLDNIKTRIVKNKILNFTLE